MKLLRFSIRRLMIVVGAVAVLLYLLVVRPLAMARAFARNVENAANDDPAAASKKWFQGFRTTNETKFEYELLERKWGHIVTGRQIVEVRLVTPEKERSNSFFVERRRYLATPMGIQEMDGPVVDIRSRGK